MNKVKDLTGKRFGKLVVLGFSHVENLYGRSNRFWKCLCDCGKEIIKDTTSLNQGYARGCENEIHGQVKDITGKKFGLLTALEFVGIRGGHAYWKCLCSCGKVHFATNGNLQNGNVSSCGCYRFSVMSKPVGEAALNHLINSYKSNARNRGHCFEISRDDFRRLTSLNCFYCGKSPSTIYHRHNTNGDYVYNGLDRIDSLKGYTLDNVVPCCSMCNQAKMEVSYKDFKNWIFKVSDHMMSKEIMFSGI